MCPMKKTKKQRAWQFLGEEEVKQQRLAKQAPGEKKKTQFMTLESHFNHVWVIGIQLKGYHVFLCPTFGILVLVSYLKC